VVPQSKVGRQEVVRMQAKVGDLLVVESRAAEAHRQECEILEVQGADGGPPYLIKWPDGHQGLVFPGPDAHIKSNA
jgi:hypothetical protein